jgi:hypothetical protein
MTIQEFIDQNNNQSVEAEDPTALDQCMDLAFKWCDELGIPRETIRHQYAHQIWDNATDVTRQYFDLIPNSADNKPTAGDITIFKVITGIPVGHVSLETGHSNIQDAITFDQNWDTIHYHHTDDKGNLLPYCRTVVHSNYYGVVGWLHPKSVIIPQPIVTTPANPCQEKDNRIQQLDAQIQQVSNERDQYKKQLEDLNTKLLLITTAPTPIPANTPNTNPLVDWLKKFLG